MNSTICTPRACAVSAKPQQAVLVAPDVEDQQHVAPVHVDQPVAPVALLAGEVKDVGPDDRQVRRHVARHRIGEAPADQHGLRPRIGEQRHDVGDLAFGDMTERGADIVERRLDACAIARRLAAAGGWRGSPATAIAPPVRSAVPTGIPDSWRSRCRATKRRMVGELTPAACENSATVFRPISG